MPWQCKLVTIDPDAPLIPQIKEPGTMYYGIPEVADNGLMSADYKRNHAGKRPPLFVRLPSTDIWCVDQQSFSGGQWGDGWIVTGDPPHITVSPSINFVGRYHGWLIAGQLSDDVEGRTFPDAPAG